MHIPTPYIKSILAITIILCASYNQTSAMHQPTENAQSLLESARSRGTQLEHGCLGEKSLLAGAIASSLIAAPAVYSTIKYVLADPQTARAMLTPLLIASGSGTIFTGSVLYKMLSTRRPRPSTHNPSLPGGV